MNKYQVTITFSKIPECIYKSFIQKLRELGAMNGVQVNIVNQKEGLNVED
jgi:hypothetical protein